MKGNKTIFSIIVPSYNSEKTIRRCIESVLAQTYRNYELIVVDDGSTDKTGTICKEYSIDNRFYYIYQDNAGEGPARNKGLEVCKGEYILFLDSDDALPHNTLEKYIKYGQYDCVVGGYERKSPSGTLSIILPESMIIFDNAGILDGFLSQNFFPFLNGIQSKMFRTDVIKDNNISFARLIVGADTEFLIKYYANCKSLIMTRDVFYRVYVTPGSMSLRSIPDAWNAEVHNYECAIQKFRLQDNSPARQVLLLRAIKSTLIYSSRSEFPVFRNNCHKIKTYISRNEIKLDKKKMSAYEHTIITLLGRDNYHILYVLMKCRVLGLSLKRIIPK